MTDQNPFLETLGGPPLPVPGVGGAAAAPVPAGVDTTQMSIPDLSSMLSRQLIQQAFDAAQGPGPEFQHPELDLAPEELTDKEMKRQRWATISEFLRAMGQLTANRGFGHDVDVGKHAREETRRITENKEANDLLRNQLAVAETNWVNEQKKEEYDRRVGQAESIMQSVTRRAQDMQDFRTQLKLEATAKIETAAAMAEGEFEGDAATTERMSSLTGWVVDIASATGEVPEDGSLRNLLQTAGIDPSPQNMDVIRWAAEQGAGMRAKEEEAARLASRNQAVEDLQDEELDRLKETRQVIKNQAEVYRKNELDPAREDFEDAENDVITTEMDLSNYLPDIENVTEEDIKALPKGKDASGMQTQTRVRNLVGNLKRLRAKRDQTRAAFEKKQAKMNDFEKRYRDLERRIMGEAGGGENAANEDAFWSWMQEQLGEGAPSEAAGGGS